MALRMGPRGRSAPPKGRAKPQTVQIRNFKGVNLTDARVAIGDDELAWSENAMTIGAGAIQILPAQGATIATIAAGVASIWGFTLTISAVATPVLISVNNDGSMSQIKTDGTVTAVAPAGSVTTAAALTIWRDGPILIVDPTYGYMSWTGAGVFSTIDATKTGTSIAVFEGRVWIGNGRTITFTAPNTNNSFVAGDGAGSTIITDEAFPGNIIALHSAFEQLWVVGQGAIEAIANVQSTGSSPSVVTTFSVTNIVAGLGSNARGSARGYFRAFSFMGPFGAYALSGVTPQKLSDKLDGMFPALTLGDAPAAVAVVQNLLVLCYLVTYTQSLAPALPKPAGDVTTATKLLLCFTQGKWFFARQGALTWITSLIVDGVTQCWGTNGSTIYRVFGAATSDDVTYKVQSKLYDYGLATTMKAQTKLGFEFQAAANINPTVTLDNEFTSQTADLTFGNTLTLLNVSGATLTLRNSANNPLTLIGAGMVLARTETEMYGHYLGWTIEGTDAPYRIQAMQTEVALTREWDK